MASDEIAIDARFARQILERCGVEIDGKNMRGRKRESRRMPALCQAFGDAIFRAGTELQQYPKRTCARGETLGDRTIDFQVLRAAAVRRTVRVNESR